MDDKKLFNSLLDEGNGLYNDKPMEAVAKYLEALDIEEEPNLLIKLGDCYFLKLKNGEEAGKYYQQAEEHLLANQDLHDYQQFNNVAWFLYEYKKDYQKALTFVEISLKKYDSYQNALDTIIRILLALDKKTDAIVYLLKLYKLNKDFADSQDLFEKYNDEMMEIAEKHLSSNEARNLYWNAGVKYHKTNRELAIKLYKKALDIEPHPYLYTNLGQCYYKSGNFEEAEKCYLLGEEDILTLDNKYSVHPYNNVAWFYYEHKKDYAKALKYFEEGLKISPKDKENIDTGIRIYFAMNKKNDALKLLAKLSRIDRKFEDSKDLFEKYEKDMNEYIGNYWKFNDKKAFVAEAVADLRKKNYIYDDQTVDYLNGTTTVFPSNQYFYYADYLLKEYYDNFIPLDDEACIKVYNLAFLTYYGYRVAYFFKDNLERTKENYKKAIQYCFLSSADKMVIVKNFIDYIYDSDNKPAFIEALKEIMIPDYIEEIVKRLPDTNAYENEKFMYSKMLLDYDYNKYEDAVKDIFTKQYYYTNFNSVLSLIKDKKFVKETIAQKVELFIDAYGTKVKNLPAVHKEVNDYLMKGVKTASFDDIIKSFTDKMPKYSEYFYSYNLNNLVIDNTDEFYKRLLMISFKFDRKNTMDGKITNTFSTAENGFTLDDVLNKIKEFDLTIEEYTEYIIAKVSNYYYSYYNDAKIFHMLLKDNYDLLLKLAKKADSKSQQFLVKHLWERDKEKTYPLLLEFATATSKSLRKEVINVLSKLPEKIEDFKKLLDAKKQAGRETGIRLLTKLKIENIAELLKELYEKETSDSMKNVLNECMLEVSKDNVVKTTEIVDGMIKENIENNMFTKDKILKSAESFKVKGSKEPVAGVSFLSVSTLPELLWKDDNSKVSLEVVYFFIHSFARTKSALPSYEGKQLGLFFEERYLKDFTTEIFKRWNEDSKTKWVFGIISAFGGNEFIKPLKDKIKTYVDYGRGAMAAIMVESMAMIGTSMALQTVDYISRKEKHKQVKGAAIEALETAAKELNLSKDELLDKIIPNFNFSKEGTLELDFGPRKFTLKLTAELELSILDSTGKTIKALPKPGKDDNEELANEATQLYKDIKKEVKEQAKLQKERLESGLAKNRLWKKAEWIELFTENPMMKLFGIGLIWGIYENNQLSITFRFQEDGSFSDINDDSFKLPENALIGMVHPIELSKEDLAIWKQQLIDYEIKQPFNQLDRSVKIFDEEQLKLSAINDFEGFMVTRGTLKSKFTKMGWENGPVEDAGCFYSYRKYIHDYNMYVDIGFLGDAMGGWEDLSKEVPIYSATFYKKGTYQSIPLSEIPTRLLSEIYNDLKTITDSGSGFNSEWKKVSW